MLYTHLYAFMYLHIFFVPFSFLINTYFFPLILLTRICWIPFKTCEHMYSHTYFGWLNCISILWKDVFQTAPLTILPLTPQHEVWTWVWLSSPLYLQLVHREGASSIPTAVVYTGWQTELQVLLSTHPAPSFTYPTHQPTQTTRHPVDVAVTWRDGAMRAGSRGGRLSSRSWRPSSRS